MRKSGERHSAADIQAAAERARTWLREHGARRNWHRGSTDRNAIDQFLVLSHDVLSSRQQAEYLRLSHYGIKSRRIRLKHEGRISEGERAHCPRLEETDKEEIRRLYASGYSQRAIAAMRRIGAERVRRLVRGVARAPKLTMADLESIFCISDTSIADWVKRGWLPGERTHPDNPRSHFRFTRADLFDLARNRASWPAWQPAQVADPELRVFAELQRRTAGARWWSVKELALYWGLTHATMNTYIGWGYLADAERATYGRACFYWFKDPPALAYRRPCASRRASVAAD